MTGAVGSLLLDWYGWQSVFYLSGGLTLLWVYYVYRYLLSEQGNRSWVGKCSKHSCQGLNRVPGHPQGGASSGDPGNARAEVPAVVSPRSVCRVLPGPKQTRGSCPPSRGSPQEQLHLQMAGGELGGLGGRDGDGEVSRKFVQTQDKRRPSEAPDTAGRTSPREQPPRALTWEHLLPPDLILALGVLAQGLPVARHSRVPWRQLFRKPSIW